MSDDTGQNSKYTTFKAEFAMADGDIVFHFFKTPEILARSPDAQRAYWADTFATALEKVAVAHFGVSADSGRLKAQHTYDEEQPFSKAEPLDAWWLRAYGFGHLLNPHKNAIHFCDLLDEELDRVTLGSTAAPVNRT